MTTITLDVPSEIAEAYQVASPEDKQQIQYLVTLLLNKKNENDLEFLRKIMDEISVRAIARGLTPEILESIINEPSTILCYRYHWEHPMFVIRQFTTRNLLRE